MNYWRRLLCYDHASRLTSYRRSIIDAIIVLNNKLENMRLSGYVATISYILLIHSAIFLISLI